MLTIPCTHHLLFPLIGTALEYDPSEPKPELNCDPDLPLPLSSLED